MSANTRKVTGAIVDSLNGYNIGGVDDWDFEKAGGGGFTISSPQVDLPIHMHIWSNGDKLCGGMCLDLSLGCRRYSVRYETIIYTD